MKTKTEGVRKIWNKYKFAALVALAGVGLLLLPAGREALTSPDPPVKTAETAEPAELQTALEEILGTVSGVGQVKVLLTLESGGEKHLAQDTELSYRGDTASPDDYTRRGETVLVKGASGEETVVVRQTYPSYRGALVVCQGGDRAEVRLAVTQAVAALTGLPTDRVTVAKWQ